MQPALCFEWQLRRETAVNQQTRSRDIACLRTGEVGDLPAGSDPMALTRFLGTLVSGMAMQAAEGATKGQLEEVIAVAMSAWPASGTPDT
jgi:hypothetical protein